MEVPPSVCVAVGGPSHAAAGLSTSVQVNDRPHSGHRS
jgi:hypothetical protein